MTERENLPTVIAAQAVAVLTEKRGSLVARGLVAVQNGTKLVLTKDNDALYHQARTVYNLITDDGGTTWFGGRIGRGWLPMSALDDAFNVFQQLASEGYGKAYYPLSTLYSGEQSVKGDKNLAQHFAKLAFEWCFANRLQDDPEIWNDLGHIYLYKDNEQALYWFRKAAAQGHAWGLFNLSGMYEFGCGVEQDYDEALCWQIKAAEQGNLVAILGLIQQCEFNGPNHEPDDEQALYWYRKAAEQGYPWTEPDFGADRFFELGKRYRYGGEYGMPSDLDKTYEYLLKAAKLDHAEAQYLLAQLNTELEEHAENWDRTEPDRWLESSAHLGFGPAQYEYATNFELPENEYDGWIGKAFAWYEERALAGDAEKQFEFATIHLSGDVNVAKRADGLRWLKAAAEQDHRAACCRLGHEYLRAKVIEHTTQQGIYWLSHAADLGDAVACVDLAELYLLGHRGGVYSRESLPKLIEIDLQVTVYWFERGFQLGWSTAAYKLGCEYLYGKHLSQNLELAEKWLLKAANAGNLSAPSVLGEEYASGVRLCQKPDAAIYWLSLVAVRSQRACLKLAEIYLDGKITPRNFDEAIKWLTHAADSGGTFRNDAMKTVAKKCLDGQFNAAEESAAQAWLVEMAAKAYETVSDAKYPAREASNAFDLGELYELGLGVEHDMENAVTWYTHAAELDNRRAQTRLDELGIDWGNT